GGRGGASAAGAGPPHALTALGMRGQTAARSSPLLAVKWEHRRPNGRRPEPIHADRHLPQPPPQPHPERPTLSWPHRSPPSMLRTLLLSSAIALALGACDRTPTEPPMPDTA